MEASEIILMIIKAFVVGGLFCLIGQILFDVAKLSPAHTMCIFVVAGAILGGLGIYDKIIDFAGAGATTPIISFGNSLVKGAIEEAEKTGLIGLFTGMFEFTSSGISTAIIFSFIASLFFKARG